MIYEQDNIGEIPTKSNEDGEDFLLEESYNGSSAEPPFGTNSLNAYGLFEQRRYYKDEIYPIEAPQPLDLWYDKPYFGKIDPMGNAIFAQNRYVKQLEAESKNVWVLDFVADAYNDFKKTFLFLNKKSVEGTPFQELEPKRGASPTLKEYDAHLDNVYKNFASVFMSKQHRQEQLVDFKSFMNLFLQFVKFNVKNTPLTLSSYIYSPYCSPTICGLMIDIVTDSHGNDIDKFNKFIDDPNFLCYTESAQNFGFKIDKNMPGRLVADVASPKMRKYLNAYPKKPDPFVLEPPVLSSPMPPTRPPAVPQIPFEPGDFVQLAIQAPSTSSGVTGPWIIMKDHTDLKNRRYPIDQIPKKINIPGQGQVNAYQELLRRQIRNNLRGGTSGVVKIWGATILKINPSQQERIAVGTLSQNVFNINPPRSSDIALIEIRGYRPASASTTGAGGVGYTEPDDFSEFVNVKIAAASLENNPDGFDYGSKVLTYYAPTSEAPILAQLGFPTGTQFGKLVMEVPLSSLHLDPGATSFTLLRFDERVSYQSRLDLWQTQFDEYMDRYNRITVANYNRKKTTYDEKLAAYQAALDFYNNASKLSFNNFLDRRFIKAYEIDLYMLKELSMQFYYSYTIEKPSVSITKIINCGDNDYKTKQKLVKREQISKDIINQKYDDGWWLSHYFQIRYYESGKKINKNVLKKYRNRVNILFKQRGVKSALQYINDKFKNLSLTT